MLPDNVFVLFAILHSINLMVGVNVSMALTLSNTCACAARLGQDALANRLLISVSFLVM